MNVFDEFQPTKSNIENLAGSFLKMGVAIKALEYTGIDRWVNSDPNTVTRNLKRGFTYYLANETVEELTTMDSNFRHINTPQGISVLVVDSLADAVVSLAMEQTQIALSVDNAVKSVAGNGNTAEMISTIVLTTLGTKAGNMLVQKLGIDKTAFKFF